MRLPLLPQAMLTAMGSPLEVSSEAIELDYCLMEESDSASLALSCGPVEATTDMCSAQHEAFHKWVPQDCIATVVTVKNTFIDGWASEEEEATELLWVSAAKSCPLPKSHQRNFDECAEDQEGGRPHCARLLGRLPADAATKAHQLSVQYLPCPSPDALPARVWPQRLSAVAATRLNEDQKALSAVCSSVSPATEASRRREAQPLERATAPPRGGAAAAAIVADSGGRRAFVGGSHVMPQEHRRPEFSVGSVSHEVGECKPCAWFWRLQGCSNGQECRHCHLCGREEVKARRKRRMSELHGPSRSTEGEGGGSALCGAARQPRPARPEARQQAVSLCLRLRPRNLIAPTIVFCCPLLM